MRTSSSFEQIAAVGHIQHLRNRDAHVTRTLAAHHHDDRRLGVFLRAKQSAGILHRQQLAFKVEHRPIADVLDARQRHLLDAQHLRQLHGGAAPGNLHQQIVDALAVDGRGLGLSLRTLFLRNHHHARLHGNRSGVQNQRQLSIAQHRGAREEANALEHRAERFDDNFLRIV